MCSNRLRPLGSLHELAEAYGVAAGPKGLRVDRLIDRMHARSGPSGESPFERALRIKYLYGRIGRPILKELLHAYREFLRGAA